MQTIVFDGEAGPLPEAELAVLMPPFDPAKVKIDFFERATLDPVTGRVVAVSRVRTLLGLNFKEWRKGVHVSPEAISFYEGMG